MKTPIDPTENDNRPFFSALLYERDGDLNLSWLFVLIMGVVGSIGFFFEVVIRTDASIPAKLAAWSFLGASFASVLISAIPIAKAKILANSKLPSDIAKGIASISPVETSTDVEEIHNKHHNTSEIG